MGFNPASSDLTDSFGATTAFAKVHEQCVWRGAVQLPKKVSAGHGAPRLCWGWVRRYTGEL